MATKCPKCDSDNPSDSKFCKECGTRLMPSKELVEVTKTLETPAKRLSRGTVFASRYEIIEQLGSGGMGSVYRVEDKKIGQEIALKLIKPEIAADKRTIERFRNELKTARIISHRNICRMFDLGEADGTHYITMEYVSGQDLKGLIRQTGKLTVDTAISISRQVCEGLSEAHNLGVIHRDLKPSNIMIDKAGNARIMDFGIARSIRGEALTGADVMIGTPDYMSPEQVEGRETDQRSDIYSLGVVLFEMLTGERPFKGDTSLSVAMKHKSEAPPNPKGLNDQIPDRLSRLVLMCLEKDKEKRYQSAEELLSALGTIAEEKLHITDKEEKKKSIVVLPFTNMSADPEQEYFSDGLTEEIIADLSRTHSLRVISRTSAMMLKGTRKSMKTIAEELGVRYALEGSVRKAGNNLRITAQLIDAADDIHLWADKYSGTLDDIFSIQENVSKSVVDALRLVLSSEERSAIRSHNIRDLRAFECLLRARTEIWKGTEASINQAIHYLNESKNVEGEKIEILSALGEAHLMLPMVTGRGMEDAVFEMENLADRIMEIDNTSSHGYLLLGLVNCKKPWGFRRAGNLLKKACELDPTNTTALMMKAMLAIEGGYPNTALECSDAAIKLDPLSPVLWLNRSYIFTLTGGFDEAAKLTEKVLSLDPSNNYYRGFAVLNFANASNLQEVEKIAEALRSGMSDNWARMGVLYDCALKKREDEFKEIISLEFKATAEWDETLSWALSQCYASVGNVEESVFWLKKAMQRGFINYPFLSEIDPFIAKIRNDDRVQKILAQIKTEWENFEV